MQDVLIIGGGAAGLMAADVAASSGRKVCIVDAMPSIGRKILMAGKSGLNLSKDAPIDQFLSQYQNQNIEPFVRNFPPSAVRQWAEDLGQECFIGSSNRLYPRAMKASPLMRAWLKRMKANGVEIRTQHRWIGGIHKPRFQTPNGQCEIEALDVVFALGGASWPRLGTDGKWQDLIDLPQNSLQAANMGFDCAWSDKMQDFAGGYLKNIVMTSGEKTAKGEFTITKTGVQSGLIYTLGEEIRIHGAQVDLLPSLSIEVLRERFRGKGKSSTANFLRKLGLSDVARALYFECKKQADIGELKSLHLPILAPRPIAEAISCSGGIRFEALDANLQSRTHERRYFVGEMVDWSAPTGGYLLTACLAMGHHVGQVLAAQN